jgi:hypothetical protein
VEGSTVAVITEPENAVLHLRRLAGPHAVPRPRTLDRSAFGLLAGYTGRHTPTTSHRRSAAPLLSDAAMETQRPREHSGRERMVEALMSELPYEMEPAEALHSTSTVPAVLGRQ